MPNLATVAFGKVRGTITPRSVPIVEGVDNPGLTPAVVLLSGADRIDPLAYQGWFATSQAAGLLALVGTVVNADDETGATVSVLVRGVQSSERPALCGGALGVWSEVSVGVTAWA